MAIEVGERVKVVHIDGEIFLGTLTGILLGLDIANPTKASITIEEKPQTLS